MASYNNPIYMLIFFEVRQVTLDKRLNVDSCTFCQTYKFPGYHELGCFKM